MKTVFAPHLGRTVKFGRRRPIATGPHLKLKNYLRAALPPTPASCDLTPKALPCLRDVMLNDSLGDCGIAGGYHIVGVETGNAGSLFTATDAQITADYSAIGGYNPNDPSSDRGIILTDALNYWSAHGFADGTKILGYLAIDATSLSELQAAVWLFGNLYLGLELPDSYVSPFPSGDGFLWGNDAPDPSNGHCVIGAGYGIDGVTIATWGLIGTITWDALAHLCIGAANGEAWVMLTPDQLARGASVAPNGVTWAQLVTDFDAMGGHVPIPAPAPPPPAPSGPVTLDQAKQWAAAGISALHGPLLTRSGAIAASARGLTASWPKGQP